MTLSDLIDAIKIGHRKLGKSTVLQGIANAANAVLGVGVSTLQKACNGNGVLQPDIKSALLLHWDDKEQNVLDYIGSIIKDPAQTAISLGIPKADDYKKDLLCKAVRMQFAVFFSSDAGDDVNNIIPDAYQKLLDDPNSMPVVGASLYPGDMAHDYSPNKRRQMDIYGTLQYEMEVQNTGKIPWINRRLMFVNENQAVRPASMDMPIPETRPSSIIKFAIELYGRGGEGTSFLRWKMVDAEGNDCFPQEPDKFHLEIETTFTPKN